MFCFVTELLVSLKGECMLWSGFYTWIWEEAQEIPQSGLVLLEQLQLSALYASRTNLSITSHKMQT